MKELKEKLNKLGKWIKENWFKIILLLLFYWFIQEISDLSIDLNMNMDADIWHDPPARYRYSK